MTDTPPLASTPPPLPLAERLARPGPKRLLALDGGGIRGLVSLGYLERLEAILRDRHRRPDLVLGDYFDLIGGTSTGAIIASLLALGRSVGEVRELYLRVGREAFQQKKSWLGRFGRVLSSRFDERPLERLMQETLGTGRTLGGDGYRSGLMVVTKRFDTGSVWPLVNLPDSLYFEHNKNIPLWEVIRGSTAAPTYFRRKRIADVGVGEEAYFIDGGVTGHNNPSVLLLQAATLEGFGLRWPVGEDRLLLCSVGTGAFLRLAGSKVLLRDRNLEVLPHIITQLLRDGSNGNELLLQWISRSPTARSIDSQIGNLENDLLGAEPLLTYLRYDVQLDAEGLRDLGMELTTEEARRLQEMSDVDNIPQLDRIGRAAAAAVEAEHFPPGFDLPGTAAESPGAA